MISDTLRTWRERAHITQADAARAMGWTPAFLNRIERGRVRPNLLHVARLAAHYGAAPEDVGRAVMGAA